MNKEMVNIGIVSKGRLKTESEKIFKKKKLKIYYDKRELIGRIKDQPNIRVLFLHAREIIEQIAIGKLDIGISGFDLLKESEEKLAKGNITDQERYILNHKIDIVKEIRI